MNFRLLAHRPQPHRTFVSQVFLLCGSVAPAAGISGRFSSSSLPPSFARGRRTAVFFCPPAAGRGGRPEGPRCGASPSSARASPAWPPPTRCATSAGHAVRGRQRFGGHTHTVDVTLGRRDAWRRHRLPGLQPPHLPAAGAAVRRAAGRDRAVGHVVLGAGPGQRPGMERLQPQHRVRPAPQPGVAALLGMLADILRFNKLATAIAVRGRRRTGRADRRLPRPPPVRPGSATATSCR
jgi:hypothetical protein